jgi:hypothetical protein
MRKYLATGAVVLMASTASAQVAPLPASEWTPQTQLWLARAMVAEAGWNAKLDYIAIAYVLARRWRTMTEQWPSLRYVDVIKRYCAGLGDFRRQHSARQRWVRALSWDDAQPSQWPKDASWAQSLPLWRTALAISEKWGKGELKDPCRGRAWHWGGLIDSPRGRMVPVDCGQTRNTFYGISWKAEASADKEQPAAPDEAGRGENAEYNE